MINASNITNYNLNTDELEARILFWVLAAGKNGTRAAKITNEMINHWNSLFPIEEPPSPFYMLQHFDYMELVEQLKYYKTGCQSIKARTLSELCRAELDLRTCTAEDLEKIFGIGMKTSRCFIIHSRKDAKYAGLDTHVLKYLKELGYDVPKSTPTRKKYLVLEEIFLQLAHLEGMLPAELDIQIWNKYKVVKEV